MKKIVMLLVLFAGGCATAPVGEPPDSLLLNGRIYTGNPAQRWAEAIAIKGERIAAVGATSELRAMAGPSTRILDLEGRLVIPGINDAHQHYPDVFPATVVSFGEVGSVAELVRHYVTASRSNPDGWLRGEFPFALIDDPAATRETLDAAIPSQPVILIVSGGHAALLNSAALRERGISDSASDPPGGWYGRDASGRLNGWLYEYAVWQTIRAAQRNASEQTFVLAFQDISRQAARMGITTIQNMSMPLLASRAAEIQQLAATPVRWRNIRLQMGEIASLSTRSDTRGPEAMIRVGGIKYIIDGTPVERGAAMKEPYKDRPGHRGRLNFDEAGIRRMIEESARSGEPLLIHAVGDGAVALLIEELSNAPKVPVRLRIEHGEGLTRDLFDDAKRLGIVVVQNPAHVMLAPLFAARWGEERQKNLVPLRSLVENGIPLALGSDGPPNPFLNIMFAAMNPTNPDEALTREQAVDAYTRGSAYAEFAENDKGTLAPGMLADIVVLSQDIFTVPLEQLPATESVLTIVGGRIVYDKAQADAERERRRSLEPID